MPEYEYTPTIDVQNLFTTLKEDKTTMPEREYVAPKVTTAELDLRERWDQLWHDHKDKSPHDMLLELFCAVLFPHKEEKK